jgi:NitT/TauT family transport system permease protein
MMNILKKILNSLKNLFFKRLIFFIGFIALWQIVYYTGIYPVVMFPSLKTIWDSLIKNCVNGELLIRTYFSLELIGKGMLIGIVLAIVLTGLAMSSKVCKNFVGSLITIAHPLPGIALIPVIILWFGLGNGSIIFIIVHSVLWPMLLNTMTGFSSVPTLYKQFGQNIGLGKIRLISGIYIPASLPNIYAGLKIGWARAWRALISAEMIFGATGTSSGLGYYILQKRSFMDTPAVFASLIVIIVIGILVEDIFFNQLGKHTVKKWGMIS